MSTPDSTVDEGLLSERVAGGMLPRVLTSFDMVPQTAHVETVCELVPEVA